MSALPGIDVQLDALEQQLLADPDLPAMVRAYLHLQAARKALVEAGGQEPKGPASIYRVPTGETFTAHFLPTRGTGKVNRGVDPSRVRVLEQAANAIRGKRFPVRTSEIFDALPEEIRAQIRGKEPKSNLSAMLFHSPHFVSHGRAGWTLVEDVAAHAPTADVPFFAQDVFERGEDKTEEDLVG